MKKNIIEKIWENHIIKSLKGYPDVLAIDLQLIHEVTSPQAFDVLREKKLKFFNPKAAVATVDHSIPTRDDREIITDPNAKNQINTLRKNCAQFGIKLFDINSGKQGVIHVIGPEIGVVQPGMTIVCGDSHTSTHGAFGAIAFGIGTTEISHVMATGCLLVHKPKTMKVNFVGIPGKGVTAKDIILKLIQKIGISGATDHMIEYTGEIISKLSMEERMTICNMSIECGAKAGLIAPDEITFEYLRDKPCSPNKEKFPKALKLWKKLKSDEGAQFDKEIEIDISSLAPMVTFGTTPAESIEIIREIPKFSQMHANCIEVAKKSLEYTGLKPEQTLEGLKIDYVFIGSCTNGRISDLREAAKIFHDRKIAKGIVAYIVPGSEQVYQQAVNEGLDKIFIKSGALFRKPGCSMCIAMNGDAVPAKKRCASTSNRNFVGRQGKDSITHLMSPVMAASAAIVGRITDCRRFI
ncbi:MAG: 3-isopropylmalate dehydratase large subunit [Candidatus Gracilibacteria bacterium]|jgi:3-isopropylmalate/(R)-2-methylmalate dehydratase large subunit